MLAILKDLLYRMELPISLFSDLVFLASQTHCKSFSNIFSPFRLFVTHCHRHIHIQNYGKTLIELPSIHKRHCNGMTPHTFHPPNCCVSIPSKPSSTASLQYLLLLHTASFVRLTTVASQSASFVTEFTKNERKNRKSCK